MNVEEINQRALALAKKALDRGLPGKCPERFLFVSISGAHLYGFPSPDSDLDLRGAHVLPLETVIGLRTYDETYEHLGGEIDGIELDCVSHDAAKYLRLLTRKNGYVLEQIFSPLVVFDGGRLDELRRLSRGAITRHVVHHYRGFFRNQEHLAEKEELPKAKTMLYLFRVVMTGIHLLRTGEVQANLRILNDQIFRRSFIDELIERKMAGKEKSTLAPEERQRLMTEAKALEAELEAAAETSPLPDDVQNLDELHRFLIRLRTK